MAAKQPRQAIIYCRISDDREGREYGVERQEAHCRKLAARRGWHVVAVLVDNDITGTGRKQRPGYDRLLDMLRDGSANAVLAVSDKRLNRNYRNAFALLDLIQERDIAVEFTKGGPINMNTAEGRGIARRKAIDAQEESEEIGERVADAKADNVRRGEFRGGGRPFGFEADGITPRSLICPACDTTEGFIITVVREEHDKHPEHDDTPCPIEAVTVTCPRGCAAQPVNAPGSEAWHLEAATRAIAEGATKRSELRKWHAEGVRTPARRKRLPDGTRTEPTPGDWTETTFLKLLLRPRNAGLMEVGGEITGKGAWPALVDEDTWRICRAILKNPARRTSPGPARKYLGGGLYLCGICQSPVKTKGRGNARNGSVYTCRTEGHVSRSVAAVDEYVEGQLIDHLTRVGAMDTSVAAPDAPAKDSTEDLTARLKGLNARLKGLADAFADDDTADPVEYRSAARRIKEKITAVEKQIAEQATATLADSDPVDWSLSPEEAWPGYDIERKRKIIATWVKVTILPAEQGRPAGWRPGSKYFNPASVDLDWIKGAAA
ncbi:hypothetical protein EJ357_03615 [Streptomyces cyaneochromogenes]|uniref:Recombinase family protein n=1 Tax=Streptomyces cyaneochromogenes TaxID=2496836 RepID=A0A3Q9ENU8_9ACTN|nr:recombinase family protein [Streptomyces cyaneochromogenes]AZQ32643.1 hypothetical protein EJ357_03615 [Streptomyces cyaneochromogenes]